jgi:hypothetical protein
MGCGRNPVTGTTFCNVEKPIKGMSCKKVGKRVLCTSKTSGGLSGMISTCKESYGPEHKNRCKEYAPTCSSGCIKPAVKKAKLAAVAKTKCAAARVKKAACGTKKTAACKKARRVVGACKAVKTRKATSRKAAPKREKFTLTA